MSTPEPATLSFRYDEDEYRDAVRRHFARRLSLRRDIAAAMIAMCAGVAMLVMHVGPAWIAGALLAVAVTLLMVLAVAFVWIPGFWWRSQPKLHDDYRLEFSDEGIAFRTATIDSKLAWSHYDRIVSDDRWHLLYYGAGFTALPRRAFSDAADEERFLVLARVHVRAAIA